MSDEVEWHIRILLADDHPVFRRGMIALLESVPGLEVVGQAGTGVQAVELARELKPDVVLMDIKMPDMLGIEATRVIADENPAINVLMITMLEDDESVYASMRSGARGYVLKGATGDEIVRAVRTVAAGEAIFGPAVARRLSGFFAGHERSRLEQSFPQLTEREREVLAMVARGSSNSQIAGRLSLTDKTVRNHVSSILAKMPARDRTDAIVRAREAGLE